MRRYREEYLDSIVRWTFTIAFALLMICGLGLVVVGTYKLVTSNFNDCNCECDGRRI